MRCTLFAFMGICLLKEHINRDDESYLLASTGVESESHDMCIPFKINEGMCYDLHSCDKLSIAHL